MTTKDSKELVKQHSSLYQEVPDFLKQEVGNQAGMENVDSSDIIIPRLGLCQSLSPQRRKGDPAFIKDLEEGKLFNTLTQDIYGDTIELIGLYFFKNRIKYFPIDEGGGIDCTSPNAIDGGRISPQGCASCQYSAWGNGARKDSEDANDPPLCTLYHNFMAFLPYVDMPSPIAVSYKSTGLKFSKQLLGAVRLTNLPMYAKLYTVTVVEMRDGNNMWYEKKITPGKYVDKNLFTQMDNLFKELSAKDVKVDTTGEEAEAFGHGANDIEGKSEAF
jgi:hypothetical protein